MYFSFRPSTLSIDVKNWTVIKSCNKKNFHVELENQINPLTTGDVPLPNIPRRMWRFRFIGNSSLISPPASPHDQLTENAEQRLSETQRSSITTPGTTLGPGNIIVFAAAVYVDRHWLLLLLALLPRVLEVLPVARRLFPVVVDFKNLQFIIHVAGRVISTACSTGGWRFDIFDGHDDVDIRTGRRKRTGRLSCVRPRGRTRRVFSVVYSRSGARRTRVHSSLQPSSHH